MKKHSARVAPLSACNSPVLTLTKVEGRRTGAGAGVCLPAGTAAGAAPPSPHPIPKFRVVRGD